MENGKERALAKARSIELLSQFDEVPNRSLVKDLGDILDRAPDVLTAEEQAQFARLSQRFAGVGKALGTVYLIRSRMAETIYDIQKEEDWKLLIMDHETKKRFHRWSDFREILAAALGISVGTIGNYIKQVRVGREVLAMQPGDFEKGVGVITVDHIVDICAGLEGRSKKSFAETVRPKTDKVERVLNQYGPEEDFVQQLQNYYRQEVAHDYEDATSLNKPPAELLAQSSRVLGRPQVWAKSLMSGHELTGFVIHLQYADYEEGDTTVVGEHEETTLLVKGPFPAVARDWVYDRLRIRDED